jgi:predicted metalloprotease with PDZ domain
VHELVHVVTRIRGEDRSDWIAEGLAEFYSIELIYRAGGMTDARHEKVYEWLADWSSHVRTLRSDSSNAEITARAVLLLRELDQEIRTRSKDRKSIDDLARALRPMRKVSTSEFIAAAEKIMGGKSKVLATPLLR